MANVYSYPLVIDHFETSTSGPGFTRPELTADAGFQTVIRDIRFEAQALGGTSVVSLIVSRPTISSFSTRLLQIQGPVAPPLSALTADQGRIVLEPGDQLFVAGAPSSGLQFFSFSLWISGYLLTLP